MKTFINVLYRRILYKIPLKFLLVLLAIVCVFIATTKADNVLSLATVYQIGTYNIGSSYTSIINNSSLLKKGVCFKLNVSGGDGLKIGFSSTQNGTPANTINYYPDQSNSFVCMRGNTYLNATRYTSNTTINGGEYFVLEDLLDTNLPLMTSLECQTEYNLIPISSVDSNYCTTNNLCPSQECPVGTGSISNVYINDILHVGAPFIFIDIPEEISWDYGYTQGGTNMLVSVEGYNVDYDYINGVVDVQSYKPDSEDLTNIVSSVLPLFVPGLCIILLLYFIFRFIKKIF